MCFGPGCQETARKNVGMCIGLTSPSPDVDVTSPIAGEPDGRTHETARSPSAANCKSISKHSFGCLTWPIPDVNMTSFILGQPSGRTKSTRSPSAANCKSTSKRSIAWLTQECQANFKCFGPGCLERPTQVCQTASRRNPRTMARSHTQSHTPMFLEENHRTDSSSKLHL